MSRQTVFFGMLQEMAHYTLVFFHKIVVSTFVVVVTFGQIVVWNCDRSGRLLVMIGAGIGHPEFRR